MRICVSILRICAIKLQELAIQLRWYTKQLTKEFYKQNLVIRHVTRPCLCMTTSIFIKITRVISMWTPHWTPVSCHGVEGPMTSGYYCEIFPFCGGGKKKKKKDDKKTKAFYDWATTGIPVKNNAYECFLFWFLMKERRSKLWSNENQRALGASSFMLWLRFPLISWTCWI